MSKRNQDVKRQLFRGYTGGNTNRKSLSLESSTQSLLSRTLRKQSDKFRKKEHHDLNEFIIHKTTSPEDYKVFSSSHPLRESKLQALEKAEQAFDDLFNHHSVDDSASEDDEPDLSSIAPPSEIYQDDILISVPGYSKEEITASKRFKPNDRKNIRISKVSDLERAFSSAEFLKTLSNDRLQEYKELNHEFLRYMDALKSERNSRIADRNMPFTERFDDDDKTDCLQSTHLEVLRDALVSLENNAWMYKRIGEL